MLLIPIFAKPFFCFFFFSVVAMPTSHTPYPPLPVGCYSAFFFPCTNTPDSRALHVCAAPYFVQHLAPYSPPPCNHTPSLGVPLPFPHLGHGGLVFCQRLSPPPKTPFKRLPSICPSISGHPHRRLLNYGPPPPPVDFWGPTNTTPSPLNLGCPPPTPRTLHRMT